ncbi:MAG: hypothetical protein BRD55_12220 [Bacteroidetes bacterium SW_9_63_38]|nr:MAG: hypothetical protein BRD55_12220 [Bacteroidetes bacterium SW_9_63_38]
MDLSEGGLSEGLQRLASITDRCRYDSDIDLNARLSSVGADNLLNLYWIVYEAVTNVDRHADAENIRIRVYEDENEWGEPVVHLAVEDDGVGFSVEEAHEESWGLRLMRYRADLLDAEVAIDSAPGDGTRVDCSLYVEDGGNGS